jgi:protein farnesyltransferase subunit beta
MTIVEASSKQRRVQLLVHSASTQAQRETEYECLPFFADLAAMSEGQLGHLRETGLLHPQDTTSLDICLLADKHIAYLEQTWNVDKQPALRASFVSLDSSRTWMLYWTLHACDLMGHRPSEEASRRIVSTIESCWSSTTVAFSPAQVQEDPILSSKAPSSLSSTTQTVNASVEFEAGGFGGGPGQLAHAATTYAAVLVLCILAKGKTTNSEASTAALRLLERIRFPLYVWMRSLLQADGAFTMHQDGERDVRATYCVVAVAKLLGILTPAVASPCAVDYVRQCQTFEGGFGGEPWSEAHGGYAFCATAALQIMNALGAVDVDSLTNWLALRQMSFEGGFSGRSNKLVDGCYSFWQGGAAAIMSMYHQEKGDMGEDPWFKGKKVAAFFDEGMLERYILLCCQDTPGGLRDKPSKRRDFYHSCYCLSGLSVAQSSRDEASELSYGHESHSRLSASHPCYNIRIEYARSIVEHFQSLPA